MLTEQGGRGVKRQLRCGFERADASSPPRGRKPGAGGKRKNGVAVVIVQMRIATFALPRAG